MRDFFQQRDRALGRSGRLVALFVLAIAVVVAGTYPVALLVQDSSRLFGNLSAFVDGKQVDTRFWRPGLFALNLIVVLAVTGLAAWWRLRSLRGGGAVVAAELGGRIVPPGSRDPAERRLLNVVEEMAIASGAPVPMVYVLDDEPGINAFAAGYAMEDAAVAVTRGLLDRLDRDEMQGVVAHEFSHIFRGDMRLNIHLLAALFGIAVLGIVGRTMLRIIPETRTGRGEGGGVTFVLLLAGALLVILGSLGLFMGRVIKAAVSRQREYLADAAAVQYTRNPGALAGALRKIAGHGSVVTSRRGGEFSHLYIADGAKWGFTRVLATHPPIDERISRLDPHGHYLRRDASAQAPAPESRLAEQLPAGAPTPALDATPSPLDGLPTPLRDGLAHPLSAMAAVHALLLSSDLSLREKQYALIRERAGETTLQETLRLESAVDALDTRLHLPMAGLAMPALRELDETGRIAFADTVRRSMDVDGELSVREFALARLLLRRLEASSVRRRPSKPVHSREGIRRDAALLMSSLARYGAEQEAEIDAAFTAGRERFALVEADLTLMDAGACGLEALGLTLDRLACTPERVRVELTHACVEVLTSDHQVTVAEEELLRTIGQALGVSTPSLPRFSIDVTIPGA